MIHALLLLLTLNAGASTDTFTPTTTATATATTTPTRTATPWGQADYNNSKVGAAGYVDPVTFKLIPPQKDFPLPVMSVPVLGATVVSYQLSVALTPVSWGTATAHRIHVELTVPSAIGGGGQIFEAGSDANAVNGPEWTVLTHAMLSQWDQVQNEWWFVSTSATPTVLRVKATLK